MRAAWLSVKRRLFLLGVFSNALLVFAVCIGAFMSECGKAHGWLAK